MLYKKKTYFFTHESIDGYGSTEPIRDTISLAPGFSLSSDLFQMSPYSPQTNINLKYAFLIANGISTNGLVRTYAF